MNVSQDFIRGNFVKVWQAHDACQNVRACQECIIDEHVLLGIAIIIGHIKL